MTATLTSTPASPVPVTDGVLFAVTGPVLPRGRVVLTDGDDRVRAVSPEFSQRDKLSGSPDAEVFLYAVTGSPGGGTYKLQLKDTLGGTTFDETAAIDYNDADSDVEAALEAVEGIGGVTVTDGVIVFDDQPIKGLSLVLSTNSLSGGTSPSVSITKTPLELSGLDRTVAGGPYYWGPIYLPPGATITADVLATADDEDIPIYEGDSFLAAPVLIYDYTP